MKYSFNDESNIFIDGSHVKANANNHKYKRTVVKKSGEFYEAEQQKEMAKDSGVFHKGEHNKVFSYTANTACGSHNYILGFEATAGKVYASTVFPLLYDKL